MSMAAQNTERNVSKNIPSILLHRLPNYKLPFQFKLQSKFQILDPLDSQFESTQSFYANHAQYVRALLCVGPSPLNADVLQQLPSLECIFGSSAGIDHIDLEECKRRGIIVTTAGDAFSEDVADFAVGLMIDVLRKLSASDRYVRNGLWSLKGDYPLGSKIGGKRVGIVGFGSIGSLVSKRLEAFGCKIAYNSRRIKPFLPFPFYSNVSELAANSDVLVISCTLTDETRHIINKEVMTSLGKDGIIINIGRGALIDEAEMVQFLVQNKIKGAGLDVFKDEPHVPTELFDLENVVLSPHRAVLTPESFAALEKVVMANIEAFFSGKPLLSPVQFE